MILDIKNAAEILSMTEDELMFAVQLKKIHAGVDEETLAWTFALEDVLKLKQQIEEIEAQEQAEAKSDD